jgi:hypothetical protein
VFLPVCDTLASQLLLPCIQRSLLMPLQDVLVLLLLLLLLLFLLMLLLHELLLQLPVLLFLL